MADIGCGYEFSLFIWRTFGPDGGDHRRKPEPELRLPGERGGVLELNFSAGISAKNGVKARAVSLIN
jgi:hypothetical protein